MSTADTQLTFSLWIASAVVGAGAGIVGLTREREVIDRLTASGSPTDQALATTLTIAFVVGAIIGLAVVALQVAFAVLLREGRRGARVGLVGLAGLILAAVALRLAAGGENGPAVTVLLVAQAVLMLAALALPACLVHQTRAYGRGGSPFEASMDDS